MGPKANLDSPRSGEDGAAGLDLAYAEFALGRMFQSIIPDIVLSASSAGDKRTATLKEAGEFRQTGWGSDQSQACHGYAINPTSSLRSGRRCCCSLRVQAIGCK